jgi:hypothetical protein
MSNKHGRNIVKFDRQKQIADFFRRNPYSTIHEASKALSITDHIVKDDLAEMAKTLKNETISTYEIHRSRILKDIADVKQKCLKKLKLCRGALAGTRWIEEWTKLTKQEAKILGLYAPERAMSLVAHVDGRENMTKEKRDAIVEAILVGDREGVIEVDVDSKNGED